MVLYGCNLMWYRYLKIRICIFADVSDEKFVISHHFMGTFACKRRIYRGGRQFNNLQLCMQMRLWSEIRAQQCHGCGRNHPDRQADSQTEATNRHTRSRTRSAWSPLAFLADCCHSRFWSLYSSLQRWDKQKRGRT